MASPTLITPTPTPTTTSKPFFFIITSKLTPTPTTTVTITRRRDLLSLATSALLSTPVLLLSATSAALASEDEEYVEDTKQVISKVRSTITLDKTDPKVADAVAQLRDTSNSWVAKYRKDKQLLGRASFRDMYSALNAVSGHYISFGPTAPIPAKRKARILEEMDTAEKALLRGR